MLSFMKELFEPGNRFAAWIALLAAIGGFLFGFDTGVVGSAEPYFSEQLHIGTFGESWVVGSLLLGAIAGAAVAGYLAEAISRKWTKFTGGLIFMGAAICSGFPPNVELLCASRFVLGLGVGTASFVAPMYISEQSPKHLRGGMTAFNQLMITFGIMIAYFSDYAFSGFGADNWRWMFAIEAIPGAALAVAMWFVPHTPRWLVERGRVDEAKAVLERTRPRSDIDREVGDIQDVVRRQTSTGLRELLTSRKLRRFLVIGVVLAALQQAVGINAVIYFGAQDLKFMGYTTATAVHQAVTIGIVNFVFALFAVLLLDWVGRKPLLITSCAGMILCLAGQGWYFLQGNGFVHSHGIVGLGSTLAFLAFFELGIGPVMWLVISEIFPLRVRSKAMAVCTMSNWIFNFLVSYFYLTMAEPGVFNRYGTDWFFGGFAILALLWAIFMVPETKGKSLEQIETEIAGDGGRSAGPASEAA